MASYYYLMASLPMLKADEKPGIDYGKFLAMCRPHVSDEVYRSLEELDISDDSGKKACAIMDRWVKFNASLLGEIGEARAKRTGRPVKSDHERTFESSALAAKVLSQDNPLEAEKTLIDGQFRFVDGLCGLHSFDEWSLFGYAMKLRILERSSVFTEEAGREEFGRLFTEIQNKIFKI